jgi:hypothetical protein
MSGKKELSIKDHPEQWVEERIKGFIAENGNNRLDLDGEVIYDEPLVGFARGDDPLYREIPLHSPGMGEASPG